MPSALNKDGYNFYFYSNSTRTNMNQFMSINRIHVTLPDGTAFSFPIAGNWRLETATPTQLCNIEVDEDGLHWPDIDEDLSFAGLLRGDHGQYVKSALGV